MHCKLLLFLLSVGLLSACPGGKESTEDNTPEEQPVALPPLDLSPDLEALLDEWRGQAHRFEIRECEVMYNGKAFFLGSTVEEIEAIIGVPADRQEGYYWGWNELGFGVS